MAKSKNLELLLGVYFVRSALVNSAYPIDRSIVLDYTPSGQRGRWNAVGSLSMGVWSGFAFLGGELADSHDYQYTFLITSFIYGVSCLIYLPLVFIVPIQTFEEIASREGSPASARPNSEASPDSAQP